MSALAGSSGWETLLLALLLRDRRAQRDRLSPIFGVGNFVNLFQLSIEKSIVALMMAFVIIGGDIDLSVASVMGLSACVMAYRSMQGAPLPLAIALALARRAFWRASTTPSGSPMSACRRSRSRWRV
jgi:rhamnose transport system permease protein